MSTKPQLIEVAPGVFAWIGVAGDSNAGAIVTPHGVVVIDAQQLPHLARDFRAELVAATGAPIRMLINTHGHLDHIAGNIVFEDVPILAHERTCAALRIDLGAKTGRNWVLPDFETTAKLLWGKNLLELMADEPGGLDWFRQRIGAPEYQSLVITEPSESFADQYEIKLPDEILRLSYLGPAHSDGDMIVHLVRRKVVFLGDLMFYRRFPWMGDCDLNGWIDRLTAVLGWDIDVVIPGHGPPTDLGEVRRFRDLFVAIRAAVEQGMKSGVSEEAAMREIRLPEYAHLPRYAEWIATNIKVTYRYLKGK
jgi:cyclase